MKVFEVSNQFELDSFVSQLALWLDREIVAKKPEFGKIDVAGRLIRICEELSRRKIAKTVELERHSLWVMAAAIERRIGGRHLAPRERYIQLSVSDGSLVAKFERFLRKHAERRLGSMLRVTEALFRLCNDGQIEIIGVESSGAFRWAATSVRAASNRDRRITLH